MDKHSQADNVEALFSDGLYWDPSTFPTHTLVNDGNSTSSQLDYLNAAKNNGGEYCTVASPGTTTIASASTAPTPACSLPTSINDVLFLGQQHPQQHVSYPNVESSLAANPLIATQMLDNNLNDVSFLGLILSQQQEQTHPQQRFSLAGKHPYLLSAETTALAAATTTTTPHAKVSSLHQLGHAAAIDYTLTERSLAGSNTAAPSTMRDNGCHQQQLQLEKNTPTIAAVMKRKTASEPNADILSADTKRKRTKRKKKVRSDQTEENGQPNGNSSSPEQTKIKRNTGLNKPLLLSPLLSTFLDGEKQLPRPEIVRRLWSYIKSNELQDPADRRFILCDAKLKKLFQKDRVNSFGMNKDLTVHLTKIETNDNNKVGSEHSTATTINRDSTKPTTPLTQQAKTTMITPSDILMGNSSASSVPTADNTPDIMTPKDSELPMVFNQFKWNYTA